jgi:hypothetical protein
MFTRPTTKLEHNGWVGGDISYMIRSVLYCTVPYMNNGIHALEPYALYNDESSSHSVKMTYSRVVDVDITFDETVCRGTTEVFN